MFNMPCIHIKEQNAKQWHLCNCVYTAAATFSLMFVIVVRTHQQVTVMITGLNEISICVCLHFNWDSLYLAA